MRACILRFFVMSALSYNFFRIIPSLIQSSVPIESERTQRTAALATHSVPNRMTPACITHPFEECGGTKAKPAIGLLENNDNLFS